MAVRKSKSTRNRWIMRGAIAAALGIALGFATGAMAVHSLQSPVTASDSIPNESARRAKRAASAPVPLPVPVADAPVRDTPVRDAPARDTPPPTDSELRGYRRVAGTLVPKVIGMQEGDARTAMTQAGFTVGAVVFKSSDQPAGTVLSTSPMPGERAQLPATVNLVLSDGHYRNDTTSKPSPPAHPAPQQPREPEFDFNFPEYRVAP